jgi:hypothetical protein
VCEAHPACYNGSAVKGDDIEKLHAIGAYVRDHILPSIGACLLFAFHAYIFLKRAKERAVMKLVDKEVTPGVHVVVELADAKLKAGAEVDIKVLLVPALDKIAELIPGHFEDSVIAEAKEKLALLIAPPSAPEAAPSA